MLQELQKRSLQHVVHRRRVAEQTPEQSPQGWFLRSKQGWFLRSKCGGQFSIVLGLFRLLIQTEASLGMSFTMRRGGALFS
jgi:hypothetical protein